MSRPISLAVVGATGLVGEALLELLAQSGLAFSEVHALASEESSGKRIEFGDRLLKVADAATFDFGRAEVALLAVPPAVSLSLAPRVADQGCLALDLSGVWLADPAVPAWCERVGGLDPEVLQQHRVLSVVTGAGAVVAEVCQALAALPLQRVGVTSLMPASAGGRAVLEDLARQTARLLNSQDPEPGVFPVQAAFSVLAAGSAGLGSAVLAPAQTLQLALGRMASLAALDVQAACAWAPVFYGGALSLDLGFAEPVSPPMVAQLLEEAGLPCEGVEAPRQARSLTADLPGVRPLVAELTGQGTESGRLGLWIGYDNVRYAAARKGVQILQLLIKDYL